VFQQSCFSIYVSAVVFQQSCFSIYVASVVFQQSCFSIYVSSVVIQQLCFSISCSSSRVSASISVFCSAVVFVFSIYSCSASVSVCSFRICVAASTVLQYLFVLRQFTFVLQRVSASVLHKQSIAINDNLDHLRHLCCSHISNTYKSRSCTNINNYHLYSNFHMHPIHSTRLFIL
jgi:hypothetical protein